MCSDGIRARWIDVAAHAAVHAADAWQSTWSAALARRALAMVLKLRIPEPRAQVGWHHCREIIADMNLSRVACALAALVVTGCGGPSEPTVVAAKADCPRRSGAGGQAAYDEARSLTSTDEYDEQVRSKRFALYRQAAEDGHLAAQHEYGWLLFQELYMGDAPEPSQRDTYVGALTDIFGAGFRGLDSARDQFPGLAAMLDAKQLADELEDPLAELPREWVAEAFERARSCYGD